MTTFLTAVSNVGKRVGIVQGASAITSFTNQSLQVDIDIIIQMWNEVMQDLAAQPHLVPGLSASGGITLVNGLREYALPTGSITGYNVTAPGTYASVPSVTIGAAPTGGVTATATASLGFQSATPSAAGSGYKIGDVLPLVGGTLETFSNAIPSQPVAQATVTSVNGTGGVTGVSLGSLAEQGSYSAVPSNPVSTTGGSGAGCTLTVTWGVAYVVPTTKGQGYTISSPPTVTFGSGSAVATPIVSTSDLVKMIVNPVNKLPLAEYPGGFVQMVADQPDPTIFQGLPLRWTINPTTGNVRFDFTPNSSVAGETFIVYYVPRISLQNTTDAFPFGDTVVDQLVPAVAMKYAKERKKGDYSREEYMRALSDAMRFLVRQTPRTRYGVSRRPSR